MNRDDSFGEDDDEMDELLVSALEDTTGILPSTSSAHAGPGGTRTSELVDGFDTSSGQTWIYPTNKQVRDYQYNIVRKCLVSNTLVCLPTGLGKTFIAAVVMYNFYRWFPRGKIIFLAPTKPLVAQQIEACFEIMGIPQSHMSEMTGSMNPKSRTIAWKEKRVFFLTPQVISNDISRGICPVTTVKCVVVDEAHKALGNHAYVQVVRELYNHGGLFRVLALSATPGSDAKQVQQVITNLLVANLEVRTDESIDIVPYIHNRKVDKVVVELDDELIEMRTQFLQIIDVYIERLHQNKVLSIRNLESLSKFTLLKERDRFRQRPPNDMYRSQLGFVEGYFAISMSLYHALDLLQFYGTRSFYVYFNEMLNGDKVTFRNRFELKKNVTFCRIMDNLEKRFKRYVLDGPSTSTSDAAAPFFYSHPKFKKLEELVMDHFKEMGDRINDTRIIVFAQYRESVREVEAVLKRHHPTARPLVLLGQNKVGGSTKGLKQKLQMEVMSSFRSGESNILVSTCVGEEGLDIGDVDLIVCFDAQQSPIRLVQRMGRTGRKRDGRVVVLLTKGKEEGNHNRGQYNQRAVNRAMTSSSASYQMYEMNPRMIPKQIEPVCHKMFLSAGAFVHEEKASKVSALESTSSNARKQRKTVSPYLNDDQLKEWKSKYYVAPNETLRFDFSPQMVSLTPEETTSKKQSLARTLSLTEWLPWQNALNPTFLVDHTQQTELFVDTMKFLEVTSCCVETDDPIKYYESSCQRTTEGKGNKRFNCNALMGSLQKKRVLIRSLYDDEPNEELPTEMVVSLANDQEDVEIIYERFSRQESIMERADVPTDSSISFFGVHEKHLQIDAGFNSLSSQRVSIRTPPTSPPIAATSMIDWLDAMELIESDIMLESSDVVCSLTDSSVAEVARVSVCDPFKTPLPIGSVKKVVGRDTPLSSMPTTSRLSLDLFESTDVSTKPFEESLYSMSQLLGIIDYSATQTPEKPSTPTRSHSVTDVQDPSWDSDDDLFANCDIVPPTPEKPEKEITTCEKSFSRHSMEFAGECSTSTPVATKCVVSTSPASEDESLRPIARVSNRRKRPRRLDLSSSDSDNDSNTKKRKSKSCSEVGKMFILDEVEVSSESAVSADETFSDRDSYEQSFVDDKQTNCETNATMYLRSVRSPRAKPGAFKLAGCGAVNNDVYSQSQPSQDSDYLEDSFCVGSDSDERSPQKRSRRVTIADSSSDETMITSPVAVVSNSSTSFSKTLNLMPSPVATSSTKDSIVVRPASSKIVVMVDSREVSSCQTIISDLRLKHNAQIVVAQLGSCDYIVSNRLAVERKFLSDIANGSLRNKLVNRIEDMSENYQRTCLIVEKDRTKPNEQLRAQSMTKYLARTLVRLSGLVSRILFTKSQEHTAEMLFHLASREARCGHGIEAKLVENEAPPTFSFYRKLLENNYIAAVNLSTKFPSLKDFIKSSPEEISLNGFLPVRKAERIHQIVKQIF